MLTLREAGNPALLEPLTCRRKALDIELGPITLGEALRKRWAEVSEHVDVTADADFWPSAELVKLLSGKNGGFQVILDGAVAAEGHGAGSAETVQADEKSFRIVYPWHILKVNEDLLSKITESDIKGTVRERVTIDGILVLGEGSVVLPGVYMEGTVVVGRNCKIGPNCYIRGSTSLGDNCHVGQAVELKNAILMNHVSAGHLSYFGDSIICPKTNFGAGTIASNFRHDGKNHRCMVQGELLDTGRRKFGTIIGDNVHTGIHSAIYPGRKLWPDVQTLPGQVVRKDLTGNEK